MAEHKHVVTLGGQDFAIPDLPIRALRTVVPAFQRLGVIKDTASFMAEEKQYDDIIAILTGALSVPPNSLSREQVLDLPLKMDELLLALPIIAQQAGLVVRRGLPVGEAQAPSTGMASS